MPRHEQNISSTFFAFTIREVFLGASFSLGLVVDDGGPFSLSLSWVGTLLERVVRVLAAAAAAAAARVGMVAVLCTTKVRIISQPLF
jgi:hypothetical protein